MQFNFLNFAEEESSLEDMTIDETEMEEVRNRKR